MTGDRVLVDGEPVDRIPVTDRGLLYGDGLFETLAMREGVIPLWDLHMRRLQVSARRLELAAPAEELLERELRALTDGCGDWLLRITLTRGDGRGYAPPPRGAERRILHARPVESWGEAEYLKVGICGERLGGSGSLAGLKHLNRLPQVLQAGELRRRGWDEGLCFDDGDRLVEATQSNVCLRLDDRWWTPPLDRCGVEGVFRQYLLERDAVKLRELGREELARCEALFLCNSVRGVRAVSEVHEVGRKSTSAVEAFCRQLGGPW